MATLAMRRSRLARNELLREVWGYENGTFTRTLDAHVARLRRKLKENPKHPEQSVLDAEKTVAHGTRLARK